MKYSFVLMISILVMLCACTDASNKANNKDLPVIAHILRMDIGKSTMREMEGLLGAGAPCMGGHPHGGRVWFLESQKLYVYADAFDYNSNGDTILYLVEIGADKSDLNIDFSYESPKPHIPHVSINDKSLGWLGTILPRQSRQTVMKLTNDLSKPIKQSNALKWTMEGNYHTVTGTQSADWKAELTFDDKMLSTIVIRVVRK